jgi:hypothetical protein
MLQATTIEIRPLIPAQLAEAIRSRPGFAFHDDTTSETPEQGELMLVPQRPQTPIPTYRALRS